MYVCLPDESFQFTRFIFTAVCICFCLIDSLDRWSFFIASSLLVKSSLTRPFPFRIFPFWLILSVYFISCTTDQNTLTVFIESLVIIILGVTKETHSCLRCIPIFSVGVSCSLMFLSSEQRFSTGVPWEFLKHATPGYLVMGTDLFSLRRSKKKKSQQAT